MTSRDDKGIAAKRWSWQEKNATLWTTGVLSATLAVGKVYTLRLEVQDIEGAWSDAKDTDIDCRLINQPPSIDAVPAYRNWGNTNISITVTATDPDNNYNGTRYIWTATPEYPLTPVENWTLTASSSFSFTLTDNGIKYLHVLAVDNVGVSTYAAFGPYCIDKIPPSVTTTYPNSGGWLKEGIFVPIEIADEGGSGIKNVESAWSKTTDALPASGWYTDLTGSYNAAMEAEGTWYLHNIAYDNATNSTYLCSGPYLIDRTPPWVEADKYPGIYESGIDVNINVGDLGGSGLTIVKYAWSESTSTPASGWTFQPSQFTASQDAQGIWYLHIEATDAAGNTTNIYFGPFTLTSSIEAYDFTVTMVFDAQWRGYYFNLNERVDYDGDGKKEGFKRKENTDIKTDKMPINKGKYMGTDYVTPSGWKKEFVKAGYRVKGYIRVDGEPSSVRFIAYYREDSNCFQGYINKAVYVPTVWDSGNIYRFDWIIPIDTDPESYIHFEFSAVKNDITYGDDKWTDVWQEYNNDKKVFYVKYTAKDDLVVNQAN